MHRFIVAVCSVVLLSGCVTDGKVRSNQLLRTAPAAPASEKSVPLLEAQIELNSLLWNVICNDLDHPKKPQICTDFKKGADAELTVLMSEIAKTPSADRARIRNEVVGQLMFSSTANCNVYLQSVRSGQVGTRTGADLVSAAMGFLGSIAKTESDAGMFAGLSGLATSFGASADRNIFAEVGVELIADEIYKIRADQRARIELKFSQAYSAWPIGLAMTDVYEFHGSCSLLKGLSAMRTAVATRDAAVKAARGAAVEAARAGGDGNTVAAAVVGVEQAFSTTSRLTSGSSAPQPTTGLVNTDLEAMEQRAMDCIAAALGRVRNDLTVQATGLVDQVKDSCKPADTANPEWDLRYVAFAREELTNATEAIDSARDAQHTETLRSEAVSAEAKAQAELATARTALMNAPEDGTAAAQANVDNETQEAKRATDALAAAKVAAEAAATKIPKERKPAEAVGKAFGDIETTLRKRIQADMSYVGGVRAAVVQYGLTAGEQGATAAQVVQGQTDTAGALATRDPVIAAMIAAAKLVADNPGTAQRGLMAARVAQAQGQAYLANYFSP